MGLLTVDHALNVDGKMRKLSVTSLSVDPNSMAAHLTRSDLKSSKKCCITCAVNGTDGDSCGMSEVSVREMKRQTVKMETVTLIGKCRENVTYCVYVNGMKFIKGQFHPKTYHAGPEAD